MQAPDFEGSGLLNLAATIERGFGGASPFPGLAALDPARLEQARCVVLLLVDGFGDERMQRHVPSLSSQRLCALSSVFPSATAPAITTLLTGAPPCAHAITAWNMDVAELGQVVTFLPFRTREGQALAGAPAALLGASPLCERITREGSVDTVLVSPREICHSPVNQSFAGPALLRPFDDLPGLVRETVAAVKEARARRYIYAYWGKLDTLSHMHGMEADPTLAHMAELERALWQLAEQLAQQDCVLLITADHGFVDIDHVCDVADHPALRACLRRPICGELRAGFCHIQPGAEARFVQYVERQLHEHFELLSVQSLIARNMFGLPPRDARLPGRIGDFVLLGRRGAVVIDRPAGAEPFRTLGAHGGLSDAEMAVPLIMFGG